jgi:hypothetical protein
MEGQLEGGIGNGFSWDAGVCGLGILIEGPSDCRKFPISRVQPKQVGKWDSVVQFICDFHPNR